MNKMNVLKTIKSIFTVALFAAMISSCEIGLGEAVDIEAPVLNVTSPVPTGSVSKEFTIRGTASDNYGIKDLTVQIEETKQKFVWDGSWKKESNGVMVAAPEAVATGDAKKIEWAITLSIPSAKSGDMYTMSAIVTDHLGNSSSKSKDERSFTVDVNEPVVSITLPALTKQYSDIVSKTASYKLQDSMLLQELKNKSFTIDGTQKEDTHLSTLYVMLDKGTDDTVVAYKTEPVLEKVATDFICKKTIEGNRSWNTEVLASDIPDAYKTDKQFFRVITESHDMAGNVERKVQGWFTYWNEADKPWVVAAFGDADYNKDHQTQVYPSCVLQGQCYDDDGLASIEADTYVYNDTSNSWERIPEKHVYLDLAEEKYPTYYAWTVNAIADNKHFKVVAQCKDKFGTLSDTVTKYLAIADVNPPKLTITEPANGSTTIGDENGNFTIKGTVRDDGQLVKDSCLKMVRIANNQKSNMLEYFDANYSGWDTIENGNKVFTIPLTGTDVAVGGYYDYTFEKSFNIFTDFEINKTEIINSQTFIFKVSDNKSSTIESFALQGDTEAPVLAITKLTVKHNNGMTVWDVSNGNQPTLPPFATGDTISYSGTWSDNSAMYWNPNGKKIGDFTLTSKGVTLTASLNADGSWESDYVKPFDATTASVTASITDWGGNTTKANASYYISSAHPQLVRISSLNPDGAYKKGDDITITLEYNKKVTFTGDGAILTLNNGGTAAYDISSGTNGSAKHYYKYVVGDNAVDVLNVKLISANSSIWKDTNNEEMKNVETLPELNLKDVRNLKIDMTAPVISQVRAITESGNYTGNKEMFFIVTFDKDVIFDKLSNVQLKLKVGSDTKILNPVSQTSSTTLLFKYIVKSATYDANGNKTASGDNGTLTFEEFAKNGCSIKDKAGNELTNLKPANVTMNTIVVDTEKPAAPEISETKDNELVYNPSGKDVKITGFEDGAEKYYSIDNGTTWSKYTTGVKLAANGTYVIKAYQIDKAGNRSNDSVAKRVTLDTGNILNSITSSTADGTYTNDGKVIEITLNFRKPVIVSNDSKLKLNIEDKTDPSVVKYALLKSGQNLKTGLAAITYTYTIDSERCKNDKCDELDVDEFIYTSITDATSQKNDISPYVPLPEVGSGTRLSDNRSIAIVTGSPEVESIRIADDGRSLTINYSAPVSKNEGNIVIKMKSGTFKAPAVMTKAQYDDCSDTIKAYYTEGTNGASFVNGGLQSDLDKKYILKFEHNGAKLLTTDTTLVKAFTDDKKDQISIPIDSTAISISGNVLTVDLSQAYVLPVKGAEYTVDVPAKLVLNVLGTESLKIASGKDTFRAPGVETPFIRIQKSTETINSGTVSQPYTAIARIDCQTPGSAIYYKDATKTSDSQTYTTQGSVITKDTESEHTSEPSIADTVSSNYTEGTNITLGDKDEENKSYSKYVGLKVLVAAKAYITVDGNKRWSDAGYEAAYRSVVIFNDSSDKNPYNNRWIRGGDKTSGGVTTPGFPFNWNKDDYSKVRAMTNVSDNQWIWVTWTINTTAYVGFIAGDMPTDAATNGPKNWCWGSCAWVALKDEYPLYPGQSITMNTSSPTCERGNWDYQAKHNENR